MFAGLSREMPDKKILQTFANPAPGRDYVIEHTHHEFTSVCPITGHPDFGSITVRYVAKARCVELKSLKLYFHAFRNEGIFFEAVTNRICDDLGSVLRPKSLTVVTDWKGRGGVTSVITAAWKAARRRRG
jgi:7-cyano-7-deazaguanine reductase